MTTAARPVVLRAPDPADAGEIERITRAVGVFREDEIPVAMEVFTALAARTDTYEGLVAEQDGRVAGWICWGPTPCTLSTFDLYWIVVDPARHGQGVGHALLAAMEAAVAGRARLMVVETAGRDDYAPTRAFYARHGYTVASRIADFYAPGDDQVRFVKDLGAVPPLRPA